MANDKAFKIKNGLTAGRLLQSSTAMSALNIDLSTGSFFSKTLTGDSTFTITNPPASGTGMGFMVAVTGGVSGGYDIQNAEYASKNKDLSGQDTNMGNIAWKSDGTKMFFVGYGNDTIYEYDASTAWDVTTASYNSTSLSVSGDGATAPFDIAFKTDGTKLFVCDNNTSSIYEYTLSTAWDVSSATFVDSKALSTNGQYPHGFDFKSDGTSFYVLGTNTGIVYQWDMTTAWDISTASYASKSLSLTTAYENIRLNSDGTKLFALLSGGVDTVNQYSLSTAWDISTATNDSISFGVGSQATTPYGLLFGDSGKKMYITDNATNYVYQYNSASTATLAWPSSIKWPGGSSPSSPSIDQVNTYVFVTSDGGTTYYGKISGASMA